MIIGAVWATAIEWQIVPGHKAAELAKTVENS